MCLKKINSFILMFITTIAKVDVYSSTLFYYNFYEKYFLITSR